jgi:hypothetical protein
MKKSFFEKTLFGFLLIFFLVEFLLFLPGFGFAQFMPEEIIEIEDKIKFKQRDATNILHSLRQKTVDEFTFTTTSEDFSLEKQVILIIFLNAIKRDIANYLFFQVPKKIIKDFSIAAIKIGSLILAQDPQQIIEEIEKFTVEKAKEYAMNWLLQNEIRVATGNLNISYSSYNRNWQEVTFPYIIVYKPLSQSSGEVGIGVYSSETIRTPHPIRAFQWEGGIEELPPFILRISREVQQTDGEYEWIKGPQFEVEFPDHVPEFKFSKPGIFDRIKQELNKTKLVAKRAV